MEDQSVTVATCRGGRSFAFEPAKTALLAIDMQKDFFDPRGGTAQLDGNCGGLPAAIPAVGRLTALARRLGCNVVHTREGFAPDLSDLPALRAGNDTVGRPGPLGRFLVRGEPGQDFVEELRPEPGELVIDKPGFGAFGLTDLDGRLKEMGVSHLILSGVTTQCCVHSTLREAVDLGYWCLTVADACAAVEPAWHEAALSLIASEDHLFGWVCDLADLEAAAA
ncbi:MAG: cysteine hydrolase [Pseudomonadota bacterium]